MVRQIWPGENRKLTVCVDSYAGGVLKGRFYNACREMERFESLMQLLVGVEAALEDQQGPQSYTVLRRFSETVPVSDGAVAFGGVQKGTAATFEIQILFRQHSSWQGVVIWKEGKQEQSFRSVLELLMLIDSALRDERTQDAG